MEGADSLGHVQCPSRGTRDAGCCPATESINGLTAESLTVGVAPWRRAEFKSTRLALALIEKRTQIRASRRGLSFDSRRRMAKLAHIRIHAYARTGRRRRSHAAIPEGRMHHRKLSVARDEVFSAREASIHRPSGNERSFAGEPCTRAI